jgi:hypothetical protein
LRAHHRPSGEQEEAGEDPQEGGVREAGGGELQAAFVMHKKKFFTGTSLRL